MSREFTSVTFSLAQKQLDTTCEGDWVLLSVEEVVEEV
jgi:hypothetical protein